MYNLRVLVEPPLPTRPRSLEQGACTTLAPTPKIRSATESIWRGIRVRGRWSLLCGHS